MTAPPPAPQRPLLIAVVGLAAQTGVTTTTVALAHAWPGPDPAIIVEADPSGGQLADLTGADPYRGLASMARAAHLGAQPVQAAEHVQYLRNGVGFLASPPGPDSQRDKWVAMLLTGRRHDRRLDELAVWNTLRATVFVDCGAAGPGSTVAPILRGADASLILVHADLADPGLAGYRIREVASRTRRPGVLLLGAERDSAYAKALGTPVLACLPHHERSATALLRRTRPWPRNRLLAAARVITASVEPQLRPPSEAAAPTTDANTAGTRTPSRRLRLRLSLRGGAVVGPTVYRIDRPAGLAPGPDAASRGTTPPGKNPADSGRPDRSDIASRAPRPPQRRISPVVPAHRGPARGTEHTGTNASSKPVAPLRSLHAVPPSDASAAPNIIASPDPEPTLPHDRSGPALAIRIFGPTRILWRGGRGPDASAAGLEITERVQPRSRELLTVLALHRNGLGRDQLLEALWGEHQPKRPSHALSNLLSRLRTAIGTATDPSHAAALLTDERLRYRLNPATVTVDYWECTTAVNTRRTARDEPDRIAASQRIIDLATMPLAGDLSRSWLDTLREGARRDALNALGWLAAHTVTVDPRTTLGMLETATETDPYNESLWQDILRLHARLGEYDALARTFSLLSKKLAEIDTTPSRETRALLDHLRNTKR